MTISRQRYSGTPTRLDLLEDLCNTRSRLDSEDRNHGKILRGDNDEFLDITDSNGRAAERCLGRSVAVVVAGSTFNAAACKVHGCETTTPSTA